MAECGVCALGRAGQVGVLEHEGLEVDDARQRRFHQRQQRRAAALRREVLHAGGDQNRPRRALLLQAGGAVEVRVVPEQACAAQALEACRVAEGFAQRLCSRTHTATHKQH